MAKRSIVSTLATAINLSFLFQFPRLFYRRRARRAKPQAPQGKTSTTDPPILSSHRPPAGPPPPSNGIQRDSPAYYNFAQHLQQFSPPGCNRLGSDDVQIIDMAPISSGGFSEVWRGSLNGRIVAVKSLRCYASPEFDPAEVGIRFFREIWASTQLSHPSIVPFLGVLSTPIHPFALLYEMMDNLDLQQYLAQHPNVSRLKLLTDISRALKHMHSLDIIHGAIKLRNVLVDSNGVARLGGLGSAFALSLPASRSDVDDGRLFCGIAPELINPHTFGLVHARTTKDTDMFAFSMLAWEVFSGKPPFAGRIEAAVILSVFNDDRPLRPVHREVTDPVWTMMERCWDKDRFQRMTASEVADLLADEA